MMSYESDWLPYTKETARRAARIAIGQALRARFETPQELSDEIQILLVVNDDVQSRHCALRAVLSEYFPIRCIGYCRRTIEAPVHSGAEVEAFLNKFGSETGAGLVVMPDTSTMLFRRTIIALAERYRLPAIYGFGFFAADGGLMSYGIDVADLFRGVATYVDRILKGAKPNELPVQLPTKFEFVINLKTAKALGLDVPTQLQQLADEVIE